MSSVELLSNKYIPKKGCTFLIYLCVCELHLTFYVVDGVIIFCPCDPSSIITYEVSYLLHRIFEMKIFIPIFPCFG